MPVIHKEALRAFLIGCCVSLVAAGCAPGEGEMEVAVPGDSPVVERRAELARHFDGGEPVEATFVLLDGRTGAATRYNATRAAERFLPASTFKVPHTLIALETGVVSGADFLIPFDSSRVGDGFWARAWSRDHTLRSAFQGSADYTLSGKTGTADGTPTWEMAWLVGYIERAGGVWYFALNMEGEEVWERWGVPAARRALVVEILGKLGVL